MNTLPSSIESLINELAKLPSIGPKTAARIAYFLLKSPKSQVFNLSESIKNAKEKIKECNICFNFAQEEQCSICSDQRRNQNQICVVEKPLDVISFEKTGDYNGVYHVLHGVISPVNNTTPHDLTINALIKRVEKNVRSVSGSEKIEVILSTNLDIEGEATAMYISKELNKIDKHKISTSRIATGLPINADLEFVDQSTLKKALERRVDIN